ncbi:MAG: hypothetical protein ACLGSD_17990 [Acidobacteriota bacterium]
MIPRSYITHFALVALMVCLAGCRKEEQVVRSAAQNAQQAEQRAQAAASERDRQRAELAKIPLPTKSLYQNVHDPSAWQNPFIAVNADYLDLRIHLADAIPSNFGKGTMLRPEAARRDEIQIRPQDLAKAITAIPAGAWQYGRVVAVAESPFTDRKKRAQVRRNVETTIQQLNDLGVVVEEWPSR